MNTSGIIRLWTGRDDTATYEDYRLKWDVVVIATGEVLRTFDDGKAAERYALRINRNAGEPTPVCAVV